MPIDNVLVGAVAHHHDRMVDVVAFVKFLHHLFQVDDFLAGNQLAERAVLLDGMELPILQFVENGWDGFLDPRV
jgi:hypothetical protein